MPLAASLSRIVDDRLASRIWAHDTSVFAADGAPESVHQAIRQRLGWLEAPAGMDRHLEHVRRFAADLRREQFTDVFLLGMGGSSLCAEVLRDVAVPRADPLRLTVLDTTDERAIREVTAGIDRTRAFFLVASKSGTTTEVAALEHYFWSVMSDAPAPGRHFAAITDPDTPLVALASGRGYRHVFLNPPDIGGRYSALSLFGLVPAVLLGIDAASLLAAACEMAAHCRIDVPENPALALGAFMGAHAAEGRDKLTLLIDPSLAALGPWVEQLVAESTGKDGRGVLPVVGEPTGEATSYRRDRAFVAIAPGDGHPVMEAARTIGQAGHPVFHITTTPALLGAEFLRWELATAIAGAVLRVNPFDEPNVREAKVRTQSQLDARATTGKFRVQPALLDASGYSQRRHRPMGGPPAGRGRYLALLDYLPAEAGRTARITQLRAALRDRSGIATTHGIGPRYLHSTGQYHKGGPDTGMFLLLTSDDEIETPIPGTSYSFSTLKRAQALGDFDALAAAGRDVTHLHFDSAATGVLEALERVVHELD